MLCSAKCVISQQSGQAGQAEIYDSNAVWFYLKLISATEEQQTFGRTKKKGKPGQIYQISDC